MGTSSSKPSADARVANDAQFTRDEVRQLRRFFTRMVAGSESTGRNNGAEPTVRTKPSTGDAPLDARRVTWPGFRDAFPAVQHAQLTRAFDFICQGRSVSAPSTAVAEVEFDYAQFVRFVALIGGRRDGALTGLRGGELDRALTALLVDLYFGPECDAMNEAGAQAAERALSCMLLHACQLVARVSAERARCDVLRLDAGERAEVAAVAQAILAQSCTGIAAKSARRANVVAWFAATLPLVARNFCQYMANTVGLATVGLATDRPVDLVIAPSPSSSAKWPLALSRIEIVLLAFAAARAVADACAPVSNGDSHPTRDADEAGEAESAGAGADARTPSTEPAGESMAAGVDWCCLYDSLRSGTSLSALLVGAAHYPAPSLLVIEATDGQVFGALLTGPVESGPRGVYSGNEHSLLFALRPQFVLAPWAGRAARHFVSATTGGLSFGGRDGCARLWLAADLTTGTARDDDTTYRAGTLAPAAFHIRRVVLLGLGGPNALRAQRARSDVSARYAEQRRKVDRVALARDWTGNEDRAIVQMAGAYDGSFADAVKSEMRSETLAQSKPL